MCITSFSWWLRPGKCCFVMTHSVVLQVQSFGARTILNKQERVALSTIKGQCCEEALFDDGTTPAAEQQNLCQL